MTVTIIAKNASQAENRFVIGSRLTAWGKTNATQAQIGRFAISNYNVPEGKKAVIQGQLACVDITTHAWASLNVFDSTTTFQTQIAVLSAIGSVSFITELTDNESFIFSADAIPNDMSGGCVMTVLELPI